MKSPCSGNTEHASADSAGEHESRGQESAEGTGPHMWLCLDLRFSSISHVRLLKLLRLKLTLCDCRQRLVVPQSYQSAIASSHYSAKPSLRAIESLRPPPVLLQSPNITR
jgi:hypothetical protein